MEGQPTSQNAVSGPRDRSLVRRAVLAGNPGGRESGSVFESHFRRNTDRRNLARFPSLIRDQTTISGCEPLPDQART